MPKSQEKSYPVATTTTRERKARKHLKRLGYKLQKTPPRYWSRGLHPVGYMIMQGISIVGGYEREIDGPDTSRDYTMTLTDVEDFIAKRAADEVRDELRAVLRTYSGLGGDRFVEVAAAMVRRAA